MKIIILESHRMVLDFSRQLCAEEPEWEVAAAVIAAIFALRPATRIVGLGWGSEVHLWGRTRNDQLAGFLDRDRMTTKDLRRALMALGQAA